MKIGENLKRLRTKNGLTQEELASRCELSKGFISQLERDLASPSISTLVDVLECLGTNLKDFFSEAVEEKTVFHKEDVFEKENREMGNRIEWIVPNSQKNDMEPLLIHLSAGGRSEIHPPHEGEEFGYILSGHIQIHIGNKIFKAKKGESFYFKPSAIHSIYNSGKIEAMVLWVVSPPSF